MITESSGGKVNTSAELPTNQRVRAIEVFLFRYGAASDSPLAELENTSLGWGIMTAYDSEGRQFKIEITQTAGPA